MTTATMSPAATNQPAVAAIRVATIADFTALKRIVMELVAMNRYTGGAVPNPPYLHAVLQSLLTNPNVGFLVAVAGDDFEGVLGLMLCENLISGDRYAAEICWYVQPARRDGLGLTLLRAAETWAAEQGARTIQMLALDGRFESLYGRRGYVPTHRIYERRLTPCRG